MIVVDRLLSIRLAFLPHFLRTCETKILWDESLYQASPFDEYGPYNMDSEAGPSRPAPLPYDDPIRKVQRPASPSSSVMSDACSQNDDRSMGNSDHTTGRGRGRGRGRGGARGRGRDGGPVYRGGRGDRRGGRGGGDSRPFYEQRGRERERSVSNPPRPLSPTSLVIARATGQNPDGSSFQETPPIPQSPHEPQSAPLEHARFLCPIRRFHTGVESSPTVPAIRAGLRAAAHQPSFRVYVWH